MDEAAKKTALRMIPYGLYVVGTKDTDGRVNAFAANWLTQASFAPPLVVLGAKAGTDSSDMIGRSGLFCVNVLETGSKDLASKFFAKVEAQDGKFGDVAFTLSPNGCPVLDDGIAYFECRVTDTITRGDHTIYVGEVVEAEVKRDVEPMTLAETGFKYGG